MLLLFCVMKLVCSSEASLAFLIWTKNSPLSDAAKNSPPINPAGTNAIELKTKKQWQVLFYNDPKTMSVIQRSSWWNGLTFKTKKFFQKVFTLMCSNFPYLDDNHGIIVNATNDNKVDIITVTQNCNNIRNQTRTQCNW
jgi:hypothetical protein